MDGLNDSAKFDQSNKSERIDNDSPIQDAPFFDVVSLWQDTPDLDSAKPKRTSDDAEKQTDDNADKKQDVVTNKWTVSGEVKPGVHRLSLTSEYRLSEADFKEANPGVAPKLNDTTGNFKVKHPTTGAVDDGWKVKSQEKDGSITMTRDYNFDVQARKDHDGVLEAMPGIPDSFIKHVQSKIDEIPPNVIANLHRHGYKIIAAYTIPDAMPELEKLTPRGWPSDMTFLDSDGTHDDISKRIIAPMRFRNGQDIEPVMRENVVTHQVGHALDFANGFLSAKPEFIDAYNKDMAAISNKNSSIVKYLSQPDGVGRQETFAALFGLVTTGPENESDRTFLTRSFPNAIKVVENQIKELK